jgi:hypothetical protein
VFKFQGRPIWQAIRLVGVIRAIQAVRKGLPVRGIETKSLTISFDFQPSKFKTKPELR